MSQAPMPIHAAGEMTAAAAGAAARPPLTRRVALRLCAVLLLALAVRLVAINARPVWYDEAFAVLFSEKGLDAMVYGTLTPVNGAAADVHPLLYYTSLNGWMRIVGQSPTAVRLWSVLLGLGTILALFALAREAFDERVGLWAALFAALTPFHVQYSQEIRMYALLGLLLVTATWCFARASRTGKLLDWLGVAVLAAASMYTQQLAAFYLAALGVLPLLQRRQRRRDLVVRMSLSAGLAALLYLPWLINLPAQLGKVGTYWVLPPTLVSPLLSLWNMLFVELEVAQPAALIASVITLSLTLILLLYAIARPARQKRSSRQAFLAVMWLVVGPILLMLAVSLLRPVYLTRALQGSALMLYLALAWLLSHGRLPGAMRGLLVSAWLISSAFGLYHLYTWNTFPRSPFAQAWRYVEAEARLSPPLRVVHANKLTMLPMTYYAEKVFGTPPGAVIQRYVRDIPGTGQDTLGLPTQAALGLLADRCVAEAAGGAPQVWLVIFEQQLDELGGTSPETLWMDAHYRRLNPIPVNDLLLIPYDQPDAVAQQARCD